MRKKDEFTLCVCIAVANAGIQNRATQTPVLDSYASSSSIKHSN